MSETQIGLILAAIPALLSVLWAGAQLTKNKTDDKIVGILRKLWGLIPVGETNPRKMGR